MGHFSCHAHNSSIYTHTHTHIYSSMSCCNHNVIETWVNFSANFNFFQDIVHVTHILLGQSIISALVSLAHMYTHTHTHLQAYSYFFNVKLQNIDYILLVDEWKNVGVCVYVCCCWILAAFSSLTFYYSTQRHKFMSATTYFIL